MYKHAADANAIDIQIVAGKAGQPTLWNIAVATLATAMINNIGCQPFPATMLCQ